MKKIITVIATLMFATQMYAAQVKPATRELTERASKSLVTNKANETQRSKYAATFVKGTSAAGLVKNVERGLAVGSLKYETALLQIADAKNKEAAEFIAEYSSTIKTEADADAVAIMATKNLETIAGAKEFSENFKSLIDKGTSPEAAYKMAAKKAAEKAKMGLEEWLDLLEKCV